MQNFSKVYIFVQFKINQNYIAKNVCVKKDVPNNCCKGSCHLQKQLDKDEKKQSSSGNNYKEKNELELFSQKHLTTSLLFNVTVNEINTSYLFTVPKGQFNPVFHPPQV